MTERKRFISIRTTNKEWKEIQRNYEASGYGSLTAYIKAVLIKQPVKLASPILVTLIKYLEGMVQDIVRIEQQVKDENGENEENGSGNIRSDSGSLRTYTRT